MAKEKRNLGVAECFIYYAKHGSTAVKHKDGVGRYEVKSQILSRYTYRSDNFIHNCDYYGNQQDDLLGRIPDVATSDRPAIVLVFGSDIQLSIGGFWKHWRLGTFKLYKSKGKPVKARNGKQKPRETKTFFVVESPPTIISTVGNNGQRFTFVDCRNWFNTTLNKLLSAFVPDVDFLEDDNSDLTPDHLECYLASIAIFRAFRSVHELQRRLGLNYLSYTASSAGFNAFKNTDAAKLIRPHGNKRIQLIERDSLYGGECRPYQTGQHFGKFFQLDINSLYPFIMQGLNVPYQADNIDPVDFSRPRELETDPSRSIAVVSVKGDDVEYPYRDESRMSWTSDLVVTTLAGAELQRAFEYNHIVNSFGSIEYSVSPLLKEIMITLLHVRSGKSDTREAVISEPAKPLANGIFGKFAQRSNVLQYRENEIPLVEYGSYLRISEATGKARKFKVSNNEVFEELEPEEISTSMVSVSAFIAAASRDYMRKCILKANKSNVYYIGIDSIVVNQSGYDNLRRARMLDDKEPGKFKLVRSSGSIVITQRNHYEIGETLVKSGIKPDSIRKSGNEFIQKILASTKSNAFSYPGNGAEFNEIVIIALNSPNGSDDRGNENRPDLAVIMGQKSLFDKTLQNLQQSLEGRPMDFLRAFRKIV